MLGTDIDIKDGSGRSRTWVEPTFWSNEVAVVACGVHGRRGSRPSRDPACMEGRVPPRPWAGSAGPDGDHCGLSCEHPNGIRPLSRPAGVTARMPRVRREWSLSLNYVIIIFSRERNASHLLHAMTRRRLDGKTASETSHHVGRKPCASDAKTCSF